MREPLLPWLSLAWALVPPCFRSLRRLLSAVYRCSFRSMSLTDGVASNWSASSSSADLVCLFLNYSPINTVFDWCYDPADGSISCVYLGTLLFNGNRIGLIMKKLARCDEPRQDERFDVTQFRTSRLARYDRLRDDQFSCLFELRVSTAGNRLMLRGVANLHQPDNHFIFVMDAALRPLNLLFYQNSVVPDYDPFSDTIFMPQKLAPAPAFALTSLHPVTFCEVLRDEFRAPVATVEETLNDRFFSVQVKVGRLFSIALISVYMAEAGSMDYQLKVFDRSSRQIVCQTSFFESGFSFYRFLVQDDSILFFSLMAHLKCYRIAQSGEGGHRIELQSTRELRSCVGSRAPSLWPHKDCRHGNFVMELFAWTLQREEFNLRGILCCSLGVYERAIVADTELLAHMLALCSADPGDNVVTACRMR